MKITIEQLRALLDEMNIKFRSNDSENITFLFEGKNSNISYRFTYSISCETVKVYAKCYLCDFLLKKRDANKALRFCNHWNATHFLPHVFMGEELPILVCEWFWDSSIEYPKDFVKENIFDAFIALSMKCLDSAVNEEIYSIPSPQKKKRKKTVSAPKKLLDVASIQQLKAIRPPRPNS